MLTTIGLYKLAEQIGIVDWISNIAKREISGWMTADQSIKLSQQLYNSILGRVADPEGLGFIAHKLRWEHQSPKDATDKSIRLLMSSVERKKLETDGIVQADEVFDFDSERDKSKSWREVDCAKRRYDIKGISTDEPSLDKPTIPASNGNFIKYIGVVAGILLLFLIFRKR